MANGSNPQTNPNALPVDPALLRAGSMAQGKPRIKLNLDGSYTIMGVNSPTAFFSPQNPLYPVAQADALGRAFDYPAGYNTRITPRGEELIGFPQLKSMADGFDVLRLIIEQRKDEVSAQGWQVAPRDPKQERDKRCDDIQKFFEKPDQYHNWDDWLRQLLEQLFVLDAASLYLQPNRGGDLYGLQIIDGATIKRVITEDGRTPTPDQGPAYQEVIKGLPAVDYVIPVAKGTPLPVDEYGQPMPELMYRPRNLRVDRFYGYSPVEQIVTTVNIALHRQFYQLSYFTNGSTPDLIFQVPETWNPDQIKNFSLYWEAMLRGNLENRRGAMFVPKGVAPYDTKEKALKDEYDEWLTRICCFAFGVSPTPFIRQMNRATADSHHEAAIQQGLEPVLRWLSNLIDGIIELKFGAPDLCFRWEEDDAIDPQEQATIDVALVGAKIYHPDEIRAKRGDDPMPDAQRAQMDLATFNAAANSTVLPDEQQQAQNDHALAMQAAKPAPVVGPTPEAKKEDEARFEKLMAALKQAPANITVEAPQVHIAPAAVNVTAPPINVTLPEIKQPDVFVDVGPTTVHAKFDSPKPRTVTASRDGHGHLVAKIEE